MASQGKQHMKMIWSWWPDVGFEPRYGGDMAFGAFTMAYFLAYKNKMDRLKVILDEFEQLMRHRAAGQNISEDIITSRTQTQELLKEVSRHFDDGWYSVATKKIENASKLAEEFTRKLKTHISLDETRRLEQMETVLKTAFGILVLLMALGVYEYCRTNQLQNSRATRHESKQ